MMSQVCVGGYLELLPKEARQDGEGDLKGAMDAPFSQHMTEGSLYLSICHACSHVFLGERNLSSITGLCHVGDSFPSVCTSVKWWR